ncbi:MAG: type II toxin-antitoxin system PemK/MazF family toxin [Ahrensia sp.]|nr:type II toxin-antitoxin system PemK/MazF family toxin [Ahrensia sp.]
MALPYYPRAGQILVCDFSGFTPPEMVKKRPVILISPKLPYRSEIVTVVPLSTTAPRHNHPYVVKLSKNYHPNELDEEPCWAKCDMVMNIGLFRLSAFKIGRRTWESPQATGNDLEAVRRGVILGLGLQSLFMDSGLCYLMHVTRFSGFKTQLAGQAIRRSMTRPE